jgi:hypothetical protein
MGKRRAIIPLVVVGLFAITAVLLWWRPTRVGSILTIPWVALPCSIFAGMLLLGLLVAVSPGVLESLIWLKGARVHDARGQIVRVRDHTRLPTSFTLSREDRRALDRWVGVRPIKWPTMVVLAMLLVGCITSGAFGWFTSDSQHMAGAVVVCVLFGFAFANRYWRRHDLRRRRDFYASIGRCASCGYDLTRLPIESDGCIVCPECGAAWRPVLRHRGHAS